ncbi:MAG: O-antigen ligase family protein [Synergistaceae bacterium]|nr:O-antigen ligase family protein [Synergistaceae bacterium]
MVFLVSPSLAKGEKSGGRGASPPLVPPVILVPLWFISLALPNLIYSGTSWHDTLHLIKWVTAGAPVGIALIVAGARLALYGDRLSFHVDLFGVLWLGLLAYALTEALWVPIRSQPGFVHELICFSAVWAFYVISWNSFPNRSLRPLLWLANLNAAVNVAFAELQIRGLKDVVVFGVDVMKTLEKFGLERVILPTPGNYIGNTGQQNMFGLWMAVCVMSSIYLYIVYATTPSGKKRHPAMTLLNLAIMGVNMWGLWQSTSRSAFLSLIAALAVIYLVVVCQFGLDYIKRLAHVVALFLLVLGLSWALNPARATEMFTKLFDIILHAESIGGRAGIWATSFAMFNMYPLWGVGLGQYKWHYLEAQSEMFKVYPANPWQYTHWAHNEFLQWFCETGVVGGVLLLAMWGLWGLFFFAMFWRGREKKADPEFIWACSLIVLISFNALWTRPFHRIENILWLALAFAISGREMAATLSPGKVFRLDNLTRVCGGVLIAASLGGLYYLGSGMVGDRLINQALTERSPNPVVQRALLERASRHLMVRNEAQKKLGYHYMREGDYFGDLKMLERGFSLIWRHFSREPHSDELSVLLNWSQRFQNIKMLETLAGYLKPGTYSLEVQEDAVDSLGNVVSALILVPLRSSGGMRVVESEKPSSDSD